VGGTGVVVGVGGSGVGVEVGEGVAMSRALTTVAVAPAGEIPPPPTGVPGATVIWIDPPLNPAARAITAMKAILYAATITPKKTPHSTRVCFDGAYGPCAIPDPYL
jgi:hypothetical protein